MEAAAPDGQTARLDGRSRRAVRPAPQREPAGGWTRSASPTAIVETHCCFCGQQCGIKLKVNDKQVIGFEPWDDFPFNEGKLCPKGVKRYLQDNHPDAC